MKLVLFNRNGDTSDTAIRPGALVDNGVIDLSPAVEGTDPNRPQEDMQYIISGFDRLRPELERLATTSSPIPLLDVLLRPPLPRPVHWQPPPQPRPASGIQLRTPPPSIGPPPVHRHDPPPLPTPDPFGWQPPPPGPPTGLCHSLILHIGIQLECLMAALHVGN